VKNPLNKLALAWLACLGACALGAQAHVTLDQPQAQAGSTYKAALRVGHGCSGQATQSLTVQVPEALRHAKPVPKAGWTLSIRRGPGVSSKDTQGAPVADRVVEVTWQARSRADWLDDAHYDEFVLRGQLTTQPGPVWFQVRQGCETVTMVWSDQPSTGTSTQGLKAPAALLEVLAAPAAPATAHHH